MVTKSLHTLPGAFHKRSQNKNQIQLPFAEWKQSCCEKLVSSSKTVSSTEQVTNLYVYNNDYHDSEIEAVNTLHSMAC